MPPRAFDPRHYQRAPAQQPRDAGRDSITVARQERMRPGKADIRELQRACSLTSPRRVADDECRESPHGEKGSRARMTRTPPPFSQERRHRAAAAFGCTSGDLPAGLLRFAGLPQPGSPANTALSAALDFVAEEPQLPDWLELARIRLWHARLHPRSEVEILSPAARSVLRRLCRYTEDLDGTALRSAAFALVPRAWLSDALADAVAAHAAEPETRPPALDLCDTSNSATLQNAAAHELEALTHELSQSWGGVAWTALRAALVWRLSYLCSVFAEVAGLPQAPPLAWQETAPGHWRAVEQIPGATAPVIATAHENPPSEDDLFLPLSVSGAVRWGVTWDAPHAWTNAYETGDTSGIAYAQWHAQQTVRRLRDTPGGARRGGRLLVPVAPCTPASVPVRHLGLGDVLRAVLELWEDALTTPDPNAVRYISLPHVLPDGTRASAAALLLSDLDAPCPTAKEPVNNAAVDDVAFAAFLAAHAVELTPAARAYLAGLADSGPGPDTISHRHEAALRAVLALLSAPDRAAAAAAEIGPPPTDGGYRTLLDPRRLVDHVRLHTDDDDPPDGLGPARLAAVRQEICEGLAAVARLYMCRKLGRVQGGYEADREADPDFVARLHDFPDPGTEPADWSLDDLRLPDPPLSFAVSFCTVDEHCASSFKHTTDDPGPARLCLLVPAGWGREVAADGWAVLAGRPVLEILRADSQGRPDVVRILDLDISMLPGATATVWHLDARCPLVNVDWSAGRPRLYMPQPAQER